MIKTIYYTGVDSGDGSISVEFFDCYESIELLEEHNPESYRGEGGGSFTINGTTDLVIQTLEDTKKYLIDYGYMDEE